MSFSIVTLAIGAIGYLLLLFLIAYATERWLPERFSHHPALYVLSLGVYATTWSYYGSVGFAAEQGILFLTIYIGVTIAFILTPVLLLPLLRLVRSHQLTSVADIFAFRFDSQAAGTLVTVLMLMGILPYIALQIRGVAEATQALAPDASPVPIAIGFCVIVTVFAIIFGTRHISPREKHVGLMAAIAFESFVKLLALLLLAMVVIKLTFGGLGGLERWLEVNPEALQAFHFSALDGPWISLLLVAFSAGFLLPRQFHMLFTENLQPRALLSAGWGFPLFLLLLSLAIPPILWAGQALGLEVPPDNYVIKLAQLSQSPVLVMLIYLGGISAASAMIIVETLALSWMTVNHLVLPFTKLQPQRDLYADLRWLRRSTIAAVIAAGYGFYAVLERSTGLVAWGLISFLAMAQFLPGIIGVLYWPRASSAGFIGGLVAGGIVWIVGALLPELTGANSLSGLDLQSFSYGGVTFWSLSLNTATFVLLSLLIPPTRREREAAAACQETGLRLSKGELKLETPYQFVQQLAPVTGEHAALAEVEKALKDQQLSWDERRPEKLYLLRDQIQRNLSGMMGPVLARMIVDERLRLDQDSRGTSAQTMQLLESRLEQSWRSFRGVAAELDQLRRYHRQVLEDLPLGIVAVTPGNRVVRWNPAMARLTGISSEDALGSLLPELPAPWGAFLTTFLDDPVASTGKRELRLDNETRFLKLHKAVIAESDSGGDRLLLVEDATELELLERELAHSERLASIGRLAAGVAHEIGNPITAIACLAQDMRGEPDPDAIDEIAEQILEQTQRVSNIVQTLLSYAHSGRPHSGTPVVVQLRKLAEDACRIVQLSKRARQVSFDNRLPPTFWVQDDSQRLLQVFVNLFTNAVDACGEGGRIEIVGRRCDDLVEVTISDNGPGIPEEILGQVLEPFVTSKPAGEGTGLGLPLAYNIIKERGGELRLESSEHGTRAIFTLPLSAPPVADASQSTAAESG